MHFRSHPQSTAAAAGRQRRPQWAEPLRWRFLVSPATVPPQLMTPFHVFSSDAARIIFSDTKGSFVCSCTITRLFLPHPSPACFRARPNECAFFETADSEYTIYRSISVEKVLFWLLHMERHSLVLVLSSEDLSYIRLSTFSIVIWWRLHIEKLCQDSRFILVDIWNCSTINSSTWQQRASSVHGKVGRPHRKYSSYNKLT